MKTFLLIFITTISFGQPSLFEKTLNIANSNEFAEKIIRSNDGHNIIVGSIDRGSGHKSIYILKVNDLGDTLWTQTYGAVNVDDYAADVVSIKNGYAICGSTRGYNKKGNNDAFLLTVNENGEWSGYPNVFGSELDDQAVKIIPTKDGNFAMIMETRPTLSYCETFIIKVDFRGNRLWSTQLPDLQPTFGGDLIEEENGDIIFGGTSTNQFEKDRDILLVRINGKDGQIKWHKSITGENNYHESLQCLIKNKAGNYLIAGIKQSPTTRYLIFYTTDGEGNQIGDKIYTIDDPGRTFSTTSPSQMIETKDGNILIVGNKGGDGFIFKIKQNGDNIYFRQYNGQFSSLVELQSGELILTGDLIDPRFRNIYLVRTNDQGKIK